MSEKGVTKMKIAFMFILLFFMLRAVYRFRVSDEQEEQKPDDEVFSYELIDSIARERDRAKGIEDIISWAECYRQGEVERMFRVSWTDAAGDNQFETFISEDFIEYLYSERSRIRSSLTEKIKTF